VSQCPHAKFGRPEDCSQCLGAAVRRIAIVGRGLTIDGELADREAAIEPWSPGVEAARRRGGARTADKTKGQKR